jgi:hypothetical protein
MINFKEWLIKEGLFEIPFGNLEKIHQYFLDSYKVYLKKPRSKFPTRNFKIDLQGTKYDFLQYLDPNVDIILKPSLGNYAGWYKPGPNNKGVIELSFVEGEHITYSTIEHEVLHYLQDLIKQVAKEKAQYPGSKNVRTKRQREKFRKKSNPFPGGLPSSNLVKKLVKEKGFDVEGNKEERRTHHEYRPIEYYTNLNSLIRILKVKYLKYVLEMLKVTNEEDYAAKKDQIKSMLANTKEKTKVFNKSLEIKSYEEKKLRKIRNISEELYRIYMKEIFKNFLDNNDFDDVLKTKKIADIINYETTSELQKKKDEKLKKITKLLQPAIGNFTEADFACKKPLRIDYFDIYDYSNLEDGNGDEGERMFADIGKDPTKEYISISITYSNLSKLFNKIRNSKNNSQEKRDKCQWDYFAIRLIDEILKNLEIYGKQISDKQPKKEDLIKMFYPGPYESCSKDEDGQFLWNQDNLEESYQGTHKPPSKDYGAPLHNLIKIYPDDVYSNVKNYTSGMLELKSGLLAISYRNKPEKKIIVYRAVPKGIDYINPGDWVTINMEYAQQHAKHPQDPEQDLDIVMGTARAEDLFTDGNSLAEWGYQGKDKINCKVL